MITKAETDVSGVFDKMLKQRVVFGVLGAILAIAVITLCPVYIIGICVGLISVIGLYEFYEVSKINSNHSPLRIIGYTFAIISTIGTIYLSSDVLKYSGTFAICFLFLMIIGMIVFRKKTTFADVALIYTGTLYVVFFFMHILLIRQLNNGKILIWILFIGAWATDTFAYFCGRLFGKHKLCPSISPKKTIEGAIGGVVGSIACICIYSHIISAINNIPYNLLNSVLISIIIAIFSQLGDLAASCIKRDYNAKDYGNLIPGHGGILDRFDSVLLIAPLVYYSLAFIPIF